jgi:hypothetical protein
MTVFQDRYRNNSGSRMKHKILSALIPVISLIIFSLSGCQTQPELAPSPIVPFVEKNTIDPASGIIATAVEPDPDGGRLVEISSAADGILVKVSFEAPVKLAQNWHQGSIYIIDEGSGKIYNNIPIAPIIGPLFSKPLRDGQQGYAMLSDPYSEIKSGSVVTAVLGNYKRLRVTVK